MREKLSILDVDVGGKRVFIRVDFNVPLDDSRQVADDTRIRASLPTLEHAVDSGARVILASHLGRPKGHDPSLSLAPVARHLSGLMNRPVAMAGDSIGKEVGALVEGLKPGEICLLENVRFHAGETKNDPEIAKQYAAMADLFVNDAFGSAHRAHASTEGIARLVTPAVAGLLLNKEIVALSGLLGAPEKPFVAILGGAKVSDKIPVIENLIGKVDEMLIGGAMAYSFVSHEGGNVGASRVEKELIPVAGRLLESARKTGVKIVLPEDSVIATAISTGAETRVVDSNAIPDGWMGLDIGPKAVAAFTGVIVPARTIFWNGPMGVFEHKPFAAGTMAVARAVAEAPAFTVVGGGDSVLAVHEGGVAERISHISTGGGASLEFLAGKTLPGIAALTDR